MSETRRIADQLKRAFEGPAWHGPALREVLDGVEAGAAAARPIASAHTIWEIVLHVTAWEDAARRRLAGSRVELSDEQDWPAVTDSSDTAWRAALERLASGNHALRDAIARFDDGWLDTVPPARQPVTAYMLMHGVIQHDLYHAGQIALLKKAAGQGGARA
jgi:uncharacterized damage-inducible protein DinB